MVLLRPQTDPLAPSKHRTRGARPQGKWGGGEATSVFVGGLTSCFQSTQIAIFIFLGAVGQKEKFRVSFLESECGYISLLHASSSFSSGNRAGSNPLVEGGGLN